MSDMATSCPHCGTEASPRVSAGEPGPATSEFAAQSTIVRGGDVQSITLMIAALVGVVYIVFRVAGS